jgi:hypothetical protein
MEESKHFFFKKKKQKISMNCGRPAGSAVNCRRWRRVTALPVGRPQLAKVFAPHPRRGFFQKALLSFILC